MKYIKNNLDYFVKFRTGVGSSEKEYIFPCETRYRETGEIAQTGVTELTDTQFEELKTNARFVSCLTSGELSETIKPLTTVAEVQAASQEKIAQAESKAQEVEKENEALKNENASLKAKLEEMAKKRQRKAKEADEAMTKTDEAKEATETAKQ